MKMIKREGQGARGQTADYRLQTTDLEGNQHALSSVLRLPTSDFRLPSSVFPNRSPFSFQLSAFSFSPLLLLSLTAFLLPLTASANLTNTWQFTNPAQYEVSDPALIQANPADGGRAELRLQEDLLNQSTLLDYIQQLVYSGVRIGSEQVLELTKDIAGKYNAPGIFRSRVIDKGEGSGSWDALFSRVSSAILPNSPGTIPETSPGLVALYRFDNNYVNAVDGIPATLVGSTVPFMTTSVVGSHAAQFRRVNGYLRAPISLEGATGFTFSMWVYPFTQSEDYATFITHGVTAGTRGFVVMSYHIRTQNMRIDVRSGPMSLATTILSIPLPSLEWTLVTLTFDSVFGVKRVYFNKSLIHSSVHANSGPFTDGGDLFIGTRPEVTSRAVNAEMDEVSVWNRALSEDEIGAFIDNLRSVQFRLRSSSTPVPTGEFTGPDGTADSFYLGVADRLAAAGSFNPIHRYLQYEARVYTDGTRSQTPQAQYIKFVTRDGAIHADGTSGDFIRGSIEQNLITAPYTAYTPYFGLTREPNGGFRTTGTYQSEPFDSGRENTVWERLRWRLPVEIVNTEPGLVGLYHLDGNWVDVSPVAGANNPAAQNNVAFNAAARLGVGAALFTESTGGSTVSNFFTTAQTVQTLSFWLRADNINDGLLEVGGGTVGISEHQLVTGGYGNDSPAVYVNADPQSAVLRPGWNHVALVWPSAVTATNLVVGRANGDYFNGMVDEMALYTRALTMGDVQVQYFNAHPVSSGRPSFRVRAADTMSALNAAAWSVPFSDPAAAAFSVRGRFFQYEAAFAGDGSGTPVAGNIRAEGNDGINNFVVATETFAQAAGGDFGGGATAWYGDEIYVENFATTDPSNLTPSDFVSTAYLAGLWHFDEASWGPGISLVDSSGRGRPGSPVNGAASSPNARVGFRSGYFDGVNDYVELSQITELAGADFSAGLWFNSRDTREGALISTFAGSGSYCEIALNSDGTQAATGKVAFVINDGSGVRSVVSPSSNMNNGAWRHVVGVRAGTYIHLYVDGVRVASTSIGNYGLLAPGVPRVMRNGTGDRYLTGFVDEVGFFGSAITPKQVGTFFASGYSTRRVNEMTFAPVDAGGPTIWQTLRWSSDGIYGSPLAAAFGVRGLWHLDDSAPTADSSGNNRVATLVGTTVAAGVFDGGRYLNGSGDHLRVAHTTALESFVFSVELWVKPESINTRSLVDKRSGSNGYGLYTDTIGRLTFQVGSGTVVDSLPLLQNVWQHVAGTFDGTTIRLYVNGELRGSAVPVGVNNASGGDFYIGRAAAGGQFLRGTVDEVAYHSRMLLNSEILDHYRAYAGTLKFQVRAGSSLPLDGETFYGPDGTANTYFSRLTEGNLLNVVPLVRYLQVKAFIGTEDHRFSPLFYGLSVSASRYPANAPWISPTVAAGFGFLGNLVGFDHTRTFNPGTDVRYQISGDGHAVASSNRWFFYDSTSGQWTQQTLTNAASIYQMETTTKDQVNSQIGKFYDQVYNATGGVFRFKAFLKSGGDQQIAVSNVTVTAARGRIVVKAPNGDERGEKALISVVPTKVEWSWAGVVSDNLEVAYSLNGYGGPWTVIATGVAKGAGGTNSVTWTTPQVPLNAEGLAFTSNAVVRIRDLNDAAVLDVSDRTFEITQRFKVVIPNGGERWYIGERNDIRWESAFDLSTRASIYFAPDGNNFFVEDGGYLVEFLATNANASAGNVYPWQTPLNVASLLSTNARIRVQAPNGAYADASDGPFSLVGVVVTSPTAGQKVKRGADDGFDIQWRSIEAGTNVHVDVSLDGGATYQTNIYSFVENQDGDNVLNWDVTQPESDQAKLRVRSLSDGRIIGYSEIFTIAGIDVIAPDGGEEWLAGSTNTIRWLAGGAGNTVSIFFTDLWEGTNTVWFPIAERIPNSLSYAWVVSERVSPVARVKVQSDEDPTLNAISAQNFSIAGVRVTYPNLPGDTLVMGQQATMTHAGAPMRWLRVNLEISYDRATTWNVLGNGAEEWTLRQPFLFRPTFPSRQTKVRATVLGATAQDQVTPLTNIVDLSDDYFTVEGMLMEAPAAASTNTLGTQTEIRWVSAGGDPTVSLYYSSQGTNNFQLIDQGVFNNQTYPGRNPYAWTVPTTLLPSIDARIKVVSGKYQAMTPPFILRGIRVTTPVSGNVWDIGSSHPVAWQYAGMDITSRGSISLSLDGGSTFQVLEADYDLISIPFYNWTIDPDLAPTTNALVRLRVLASGTPADVGFIANSDRFTLKGIKILSPATGSSVKLGETSTISFIAAAAGSTATITYSADGGATYDPVPVVANLPMATGMNTFNWAVELNRTPSTNAVIKITGTEDSKVSGVFNLGGIRVDRPISYDIWAVGEFNTIEWVAQVAEPIFNLDLIYPDNTTLPVAQNVVGGSRQYQLPPAAMRGQETISNVVLRVTDRAGTSMGLSDPFRLVSQPIIEVVSPAAGDYIRVGEEVQITWVKGGSMQAADFTVWFSGDNFATPPEDVGRTVTFNPANNTFSMPWVVPDRLGPKTIMVTNSVNPTLTAFSGLFNIVGSFELTYPNGDDGEEDFYANQTKAVSWFTEGSVPFVNLYYKAGAGAWVKVNSSPFDNNPRQGRYQTFYQWTAPTLRSDSVLLRVQDADYPDPNLFDGTRIGPYDDSDGPFALKYFTVEWEIGYMFEDEETGAIEFRELDKLSVTDSSGWSITGLTSPFTTNYPYGAFDTVWYRQFFNDKVDFRWLSDRDQTRRLIMQPSDTEPDATVLANFTYDPGEELLTIHSWIERGGRVLSNPDSTTIQIYGTDGSSITQLSSSTVLADGFFRIEWDISEELADGTLKVGSTYLARVEVMYNRVIYSAAVTYTLSLAPEFETVEKIFEKLISVETNLSGQVTGLSGQVTNLTALTTDFRDNAMASLGTIEDRTGTILTNITDVAGQLADFTNAVVAPLSLLTNQIVEVFGPTLTNMAVQIEDLVDATAGDQARILNRPTTVELGSTNTILYKTTGGLDSGTVRLTVEGTGLQFSMSEVGVGLGIYGVDIIADWGLGPFMISCSDPNASDRMILEVVQAGDDSISGLAATLKSLESQMTNMTEILTTLNDPTEGLSAMISSIDSSLAQVEASLGAAISGSTSGAAGEVASLQSLLGGGSGEGSAADAALYNSLIGMSSRLDQIFGESSDAAKFASSAKNEAGAAVTAVRELKEMLESGEFSMEAASVRMDAIRAAIETANANIENIPRAVGAEAMQSQISSVADQLERMAREQGFVYEVALKQMKAAEEGGLGGKGADDEIITVLNQNMSEVKVSLEFMQKVLDEQQFKPVVTDSWLGAE